jgi:hypothetical protein
MAGSHPTRLGTRIARAALAGLLPVLAAALSGCQSVQNSAPSQTLVRVIDASYNAPAVDVKVGTTAIATNIGAATITNYAFLPPEDTTAYVYPTKTTTATASAEGDFLVAQQHSVFITDSGTSYTATILTDQATTAPAGYFSIRFLQQAVHAGAVDIYLVPSTSTLAGSKPLLTDVTPQSVEDYVNVMAGTYTIVVTPTGVLTTPYTDSQITFVAGQVRTALIMDAQLTTNPPVTVVIGDDLD